MLTEEKVKAIVIKRRGGGPWLEYLGCWTIGPVNVHEIWTTTPGDNQAVFWLEHANGERVKVYPQTRFIVERANGFEYFDYFSNLARYLNDRFVTAARQGADFDLIVEKEKEALKLKRISLYVASSVFVAAVGSMIVALFTGVEAAPLLFVTALAGLVSSGAVLFFGVWQPVTTTKSGSGKSTSA
jgi:hypothetical protein